MNTSDNPRRTGSVTLVVLISLIVCTGVLGAHVRSILQTRRHQAALHRVHQADWILRAGADRALKKVETNEDYNGGEWELKKPPTCFDKVAVTTTVDRSSTDRIVLQLKLEARVGEAAVLRRSSEFELATSPSP